MKQCPFCKKEDLHDQATRCPHCRGNIAQHEMYHSKIPTWQIIVCALVALGALALVLAKNL